MIGREIPIGKLSEINNGEMKEVSARGTKILLTRIDGICYAVGAKCPHKGAPLVGGVLISDQIVCPWHHSCFNAKTGDFQEPPTFDSLPRFDLKIENDQIIVQLPEIENDRKTPKMTKRNLKDEKLFVILGTGAAGFMAAQTLRENGFTGRLVMITHENRLPYDRPDLSKDYLQGKTETKGLPLRSGEFFEENSIEILLEKEVMNILAAEKKITFADGGNMVFDSLLIATGGTPIKLTFQVEEHKNLFMLRSPRDADAIIKTAEEGKSVIVIGSSFIGMEAAGSLKMLGCDVTVVAQEKVPFEKTLGHDIGRLFQQIHEQNGVKFKLGENVIGAEGNGKVEAILLESGGFLETDFVIVGVGVKPATSFLQGVVLHGDGGVISDQYLCIAEDIYAAGDIVHYPDPRTNELTRIEHWRVAMQQGQIAAHNMMGEKRVFTAIPFFWTTQFDVTLNYVGHVKEWDRIIFQGNVENRDFLAFYMKDRRISAVAGMNRDREIAFWDGMLKHGSVPSINDLNNYSFPI